MNKGMTDMFKTVRVSNGHFDTYWNDVKMPYTIVNGSLGLSGRNTVNTYGVSHAGKVNWIGSLVSCKKLLERKFATLQRKLDAHD